VLHALAVREKVLDVPAQMAEHLSQESHAEYK
jgi:hypothetical protein